MTDYNDGKWHGWNGGECPVDPRAEIEIRWADPKESTNNHSGPAGKWDARCWSDPPLFGQIIAFRVTKPGPRKPREFHINPHGGVYELHPEQDPVSLPAGWIHVVEKTSTQGDTK